MTASRRPAALALRLGASAALAWFTLPAVAAVPLPAGAAAILVIALTMWSEVAGLTAAVALAPAGLLLAPPPARAAELLVCAFLAAWLAAVWRPLTPARVPAGALRAALLFAACAGASWLAYVAGGTAGVQPLYVPVVIARALSLDHLAYTSPEPETFTLLPLLAGLGFFAASALVTSGRHHARFAIAAAIAISAAVLAVLTIADVVRQWAGVDYGLWFLGRYLRGERFSLHLADLNAAGSQYVLGALIAIALAVRDHARRGLWIAVAVAIAPALWISGSRSASLGALLAGAGLIPLVGTGASMRLTPRTAALLAAIVAALAVGGALVASGPAEQGTASNALRLRAQFLVTSARMFASAPAFGVGIGHYHERSNEFMPAALRQVYQYENAHNYFAQQFAELGIVGGALFVWLVAAALAPGWREVRRTAGTDAVSLGLLAACIGYLLTCVTGHPLLVPEAAMPFWAAVGAVASMGLSAGAAEDRRTHGLYRWAALLVLALAIVNVGWQLRRATLTTTQPGERGFYNLETDADGRAFVWMTRHGVFYVGPQRGSLAIPLRAPDFLEDERPFLVAIDVEGRREGVYEARPDRWTVVEIPIRRSSAGAFRRIDLRANRSWSPMRDRGERADDEPRSVMVGETRWTTAGGR